MDNFNIDELTPHTWMNLEFFEEVLRSIENENFSKILDFKISPATAKGDHFASVMFRVVIKYLVINNTQKEISIVMKTLPEEDGAKKELLKESHIFETEIRMFREVIPKFEELLESIGDKTTLAAKILYSSLSPRKVIVLEDITKKGLTAIGQRLTTVDEVRMALDKLAKWHACSYFMNSKDKGCLQTFQEGIFNMAGVENNELFPTGVAKLIKLANVTPQLQKFVPKLEKIKDKLFEKCTKVYEFCKSDAKLNVLTHGDFHAKNLMLRFDQNGLAEEVMLIDFQICTWGSMALDLIYARYMMLDSENRATHEDELISQFFETFLNTLKGLGYKGQLPKYSDLQEDFLKLGHIDLYLASTFLPFMHALINDPQVDPNEIMSSGDVMLGLYSAPTYIKDIEILLNKFLYKGYLDGYDDDE